MNKEHSIYETMEIMFDFFKKRDAISVPRERGDRLKISDSKGKPYNIESVGSSYKLNDSAVDRIKKFIKLLETCTSWKFKVNDWTWDNFDFYQFTKSDFKGEGNRVNGDNFKKMIQKNPMSWAMTSGQNIEYTLEYPDKLF